MSRAPARFLYSAVASGNHCGIQSTIVKKLVVKKRKKKKRTWGSRHVASRAPFGRGVSVDDMSYL